MPRRRKGVQPPYLLHKASGLAYCTVQGHRHYLGAHGSPDSRRRYQDVIREWERGQQALEQPAPISAGCSIRALVHAFLQHARTHYRTPEGDATEEYRGLVHTLAPLLAQHGTEPAATFRPRDLKALRQAWVDAGLARETVNKYTHRLRRCFRWAVGEELLPPEVLLALEQVPDLQPGRSGARETEPVLPVAEADVLATLPHLTRPVAAMVRLQLLVGCRPGEVCRLRGEELDRTGTARLGRRTIHLAGVWVWQPRQHKTRHKGKVVLYLLGPQAQALLADWLSEDPTEYLFRPRQALSEFWDRATSPERSRRKPTSVGNAGERYQEGSYYSAIQAGAEKAGVEPWGPNRLRHSAATRYDQTEGLQVASTILGHADPETSLIYIESNLRKAAEAVLRMG